MRVPKIGDWIYDDDEDMVRIVDHIWSFGKAHKFETFNPASGQFGTLLVEGN